MNTSGKCSMIYQKSLLAALLTIYHLSSVHADAESLNTLQALGSGMQDVVLHTVSSCPEIFGLERNKDMEQNVLCKILVKLQSSYKQESIARAYYGGPAYHTYVSGFEPMTLLAGLAFLAFLLQTLHALIYRNPATTSLAPVSISRGSSDHEPQLSNTIVSALEKYVRKPNCSTSTYSI